MSVERVAREMQMRGRGTAVQCMSAPAAHNSYQSSAGRCSPDNRPGALTTPPLPSNSQLPRVRTAHGSLSVRDALTHLDEGGASAAVEHGRHSGRV